MVPFPFPKGSKAISSDMSSLRLLALFEDPSGGLDTLFSPGSALVGERRRSFRFGFSEDPSSEL